MTPIRKTKPSRKKTGAQKSPPFVSEMGHRRTALGDALYIRIRTEDYRPLTWREVWDTFADRYPGKWAVQCFPPAEELVDEVNMYHLFVLDEPPHGFNINKASHWAMT